MKIRLNGSDKEIAEEISILDFVKQEGYRTDRIAVELNEQIVPKVNYAQILLHSGDVVEVVNFVGGG